MAKQSKDCDAKLRGPVKWQPVASIVSIALQVMLFCLFGGKMEGYITVNELAKQWNMAPRTIQMLCAKGKIPGASKFGNAWAVPSDATRPVDKRVTTGEYKNWRSKHSKHD